MQWPGNPRMRRRRFILVVLSALLFAPAISARAASNTIVPDDRNHGLSVQDALTRGARSTLLYYTHPVRGQAHQSEECTANFYTVGLRRGLDSVTPRLIAENFCGRFGMVGTVLNNADIMIIARQRVEFWHKDVGKVGEWSLKDNAATAHLLANTDEVVSRFAANSNGDIVLGETIGGFTQGHYRNADAVLVGLDRDGATRWIHELSGTGHILSIRNAWISEDGSALFHAQVLAEGAESLSPDEAPEGVVISSEERLYFVDASGRLGEPLVVARYQQPDFGALENPPDPATDPQGFRELLAQGNAEGVRKMVVHSRQEGGFHLLVERSSQREQRDGHFLISLAASGGLVSTISLSDRINKDELNNWTDFSVSGKHLVLFGMRAATQLSVVTTGRRYYQQGTLSWFGLTDGSAVTRLVPLDKRYLEAAMAAGDEQVQDLENLPEGDPVLLMDLNGMPVAVSVGKLNGRRALRLDEGTDELDVFIKSHDRVLAEQARQASKRNELLTNMSDPQAALVDAMGLTREEFANMSDDERGAAMMQNGNFGAVMAATLRQVGKAMAKQGESSRNGPVGQHMPAGLASVLGLADLPGGGPSAAPSAADVLRLDASRRGLIAFQNPERGAITLVILERQTYRELLRKTYGDGNIREYVDFGRFDLPLSEISVIYLNAGNEILGNLTPTIAE